MARFNHFCTSGWVPRGRHVAMPSNDQCLIDQHMLERDFGHMPGCLAQRKQHSTALHATPW